MAGGYDGTKFYPEPTDKRSTLKLVDNESFEARALVSKLVLSRKYCQANFFNLLFFQATFHSKVSLHGWLG